MNSSSVETLVSNGLFCDRIFSVIFGRLVSIFYTYQYHVPYMFGGDSCIAGIRDDKSLTGSDMNLHRRESSTFLPIWFCRFGFINLGVNAKALDFMVVVCGNGGGSGGIPMGTGGKVTFGKGVRLVEGEDGIGRRGILRSG